MKENIKIKLDMSKENFKSKMRTYVVDLKHEIIVNIFSSYYVKLFNSKKKWKLGKNKIELRKKEQKAL